MRITILIRAIQKTYMIINRIYNILIHKKISCKKRKRKCKFIKKKKFSLARISTLVRNMRPI